jgi:hypothetical protein
MWSRTSRRRVPIRRSQMAFALGAWGWAAQDAQATVFEDRVERGGEVPAAVVDQEFHLLQPRAHLDGEVPGLLYGSCSVGVGGDPKDTLARQLADAVRRVHQGLRVVDATLAAESLVYGDSPLTERETDVLHAARRGAGGGAVADIARVLRLSSGRCAITCRQPSAGREPRTRAEAARLARGRGRLLT